jgi:signal transduction histidine kinase
MLYVKINKIIRVESKEVKGSTFSFTLPARKHIVPIEYFKKCLQKIK